MIKTVSAVVALLVAGTVYIVSIDILARHLEKRQVAEVKDADLGLRCKLIKAADSSVDSVRCENPEILCYYFSTGVACRFKGGN